MTRPTAWLVHRQRCGHAVLRDPGDGRGPATGLAAIPAWPVASGGSRKFTKIGFQPLFATRNRHATLKQNWRFLEIYIAFFTELSDLG